MITKGWPQWFLEVSRRRSPKNGCWQLVGNVHGKAPNKISWATINENGKKSTPTTITEEWSTKIDRQLSQKTANKS